MVTSASQLPKAKRSLLSLLVTAALAAGAFLLLSEDAPPQGGGVALRLERADEEDRESRALQALADAGALPAHRALRREWFLIEEPDGKRKWRRHRWKWYKQQKEKGVTICRHKRKSKKATCQSNKTPKNQVQDATPPTPPADGGNPPATTTTTTAAATTVATTTIPSYDWCADVTEGCGNYNRRGCVKFPVNEPFDLMCDTYAPDGSIEIQCELQEAMPWLVGTLFCGGATGVTKTFGNPFITPTLDESRDWCTDFCGDLSGCLQFPDMSATYRAPFCERQGQIGYCLDTPNSAFTGSVECSGDTQIGSGHVGYNLFLGGGYGKGTSPYYPDNNA